VFVTLFPGGFEERPGALVGYADGAVEQHVRNSFGDAVRVETVERGWEDRWRDFHHGVRVGAFWIGPPWERAPHDAVPVVVDPGRAFGTGAHPSTQLCVAALQEVEPSSVLDVGCGSGVVAIAAAMLGFAPVHAIDVDPAAVEATLRNAAANGVTVAVRVADALTDPLARVGVVVANIALEPVEQLAARVDCDELVTAGYLERDRPELRRFDHRRRRTLDGWAADVWSRAAPG
jgi:ribosomal protein L11 methyltransferase